jgi:ABC-type transport system involved in multi-copper enzyme maturation permease subunit
MYGLTPVYLFGWVPAVGLLSYLAALVLTTIGIRELQELSTGRAILVMVIAIMVPLIIAICLVVIFWFVVAAPYLSTLINHHY